MVEKRLVGRTDDAVVVVVVAVFIAVVVVVVMGDVVDAVAAD